MRLRLRGEPHPAPNKQGSAVVIIPSAFVDACRPLQMPQTCILTLQRTGSRDPRRKSMGSILRGRNENNTPCDGAIKSNLEKI